MGSNLATPSNKYVSSKTSLGISVYYKNDGNSVVSTIQIPKETDLKSFLLLNQQENSRMFLNEIESKLLSSPKSTSSSTDSIYTPIDNLNEFDSLDCLDLNETTYDELASNLDDFGTRPHRQRLNSNENFVIIVQNLDFSSDYDDDLLNMNMTNGNTNNSKTRTRNSNEIFLSNDIVLNVMNIKNECSNFFNQFLKV